MDLIKLISVIIPVPSWRKRFRVNAWRYLYGRYARRSGHVDETCIFNGHVKLNNKTTLGEGTCMGGLEVAGSGALTVGRYCHFAPEVLVLTQNHDYDTGDAIPYGGRNILKPVVIDDFVWIGRRVTILPGTHIGEGAIVQAGAVVHGEIPAMSIAGGNPAKVFKYRDQEHFEIMKSKGAFRCGPERNRKNG